MAKIASLEPLPFNSSDQSNPNFTTALDSLPLPQFDPDFFSDDLTLPEDLLVELGFDGDFDFSFDDLPLTDENGDFLVGDCSQVFSSSVSVDHTGVQPMCQVSGIRDGSGDSGVSSSSQQISGDRSSSYVAKFLNSPSPDSGSCGREFCEPVSSQDSAGVLDQQSPDSGACESGVDGVINSPSPESGCCEREFSGSVPSSPNSGNMPSPAVPDKKIKLEEVGKMCLSKRKKDKEDGNTNPRNCKFPRSILSENANSPCAFIAENEEDDRKKTRLMRNRESAQLSRQRKKHYVEELEDKVRSMHSTITDLNSKISYFMAENANLRQQLGGGGVYPPPIGVYPPPPMAPMTYPWIPCASYAMRPQGSQVPLIPIPKLKPQQPSSASKGKKSESKKTEGRTKKLASVSFLGLLFFIFLFSGLVPFVRDRYGVSRDTIASGLEFSNNGFNVQPRGKVLTVSGRVNAANQSLGVGLLTGTSSFKEGVSKRMRCKRDRTDGAESEVKQNEQRSSPSPGSDWFVRVGNASEPLVASLYVPRNDKLVKIDGNLIINSILASEKAVASSHAETGAQKDKAAASSPRETRETGLAIPSNLVPALAGRNAKRHPHLFRRQSKQQKALTSGSGDTQKDNLKSTAADGSLHQWFREGLSGPMLSSGMCTEVFQFNVSPASTNPGAIIPATSVANISTESPPDSARHSQNRRILDHLGIPLAESPFNMTEQHAGGPSQNTTFQGNKSLSSMVVSVLVDPRDNEGDGVISPRSLPRIFVVVLVDSVKYVTYSCMLPLKGSSPHLVTS